MDLSRRTAYIYLYLRSSPWGKGQLIGLWRRNRGTGIQNLEVIDSSTKLQKDLLLTLRSWKVGGQKERCMYEDSTINKRKLYQTDREGQEEGTEEKISSRALRPENKARCREIRNSAHDDVCAAP